MSSKRTIFGYPILAALLTAAAIFAISCSKAAQSNAPAAEAQTYRSTGVIREVKLNGSITIDHQDIPGLMPAMTMTWGLADPSLANGLAAGDKVAFEVAKNGSEIKFTKISKIVETSAVNGSEIFAANCAECHGPKGEGTKKGIPLISGHALAHTADEYVKQVENGTPKKMPPFREKLSDEQISAVVTYLRTVIQAGIERPSGHEHH